MQSGKPSLLLPDRPLPGLARVLVDVIFEAIERIREQDDTVLLLEQHALAAFEIADYLYVPEFGKLNMLGDAPKLLDESFVTAANLEGHLVKAIVYDVVGAPALVRDVAEPDCPEDGAVITVRATGVCRSDWHAWRGHEAVPLPHIPGHEFAGVIAAVGAQVRGFAPGDRVTAPFVNGCGRCDWCRAGDAQICPDQTQPGFSHPGSFAERVVVRVADVNLVRLPDELDFVSAAALGCRFATAFRALTAYRRVEPEDWVVVFGCGGVGLSAIMIARALGARVIGVDLSAAARARAAELGAVAIDVAETSTAIAELTGAGAHLTVDAVGSAATALAAVSGLRRGGQHVQVGLMLDADALAPLPWELLVARELRVAGSHGMSAADYPAMLAMITDGRLDLARADRRTHSAREGGRGDDGHGQPGGPACRDHRRRLRHRRLITQPPHDEVGRYEVQCSVGQKRDESAGPCTPDCDRRPAGAIDEAGVDGVKHGAAPARVNKVRVPQADRPTDARHLQKASLTARLSC